MSHWLVRAASRSLFNNKRYKLVALCLSVTLFVLVNTSQNQLRWIRIDVTYQIPDDRAFAERPPAYAEVAVQGAWRRLKRLTEDGVPQIELRVGKEATADFTVRDRVQLPPGISFFSSDPRVLRVRTGPRRRKQVPVVARREGLPERGFEVTKWDVVPDMVTISGAEEVLDSIDEVSTEPVRLEGKREAFQNRVKVVSPNDLVRLEEREITVAFEIAERVVEQELGLIELKLTATQQGLSVAPNQVNVIARGSGKALAAMPKDVVATVVVRDSVQLDKPTQLPVTITPSVPGVAFEVVPPTVVVTATTR